MDERILNSAIQGVVLGCGRGGRQQNGTLRPQAKSGFSANYTLYYYSHFTSDNGILSNPFLNRVSTILAND